MKKTQREGAKTQRTENQKNMIGVRSRDFIAP
jgi:hypothetical protein